MRSFTSQRVVKSYAVEVVAPRILECQIDSFQRLESHHLTVVTIDEENENADQVGSEYEALSEEMASAIGEADFIIAKARAEAAEIRRQAEQDAAERIAKAREEQESLRLQLEAAVRAEVLPQARQEGYEEGVRTGREEAANLRAEACTLLKLAQTALEQEYIKADKDILHLSILIAERLVRAELTADHTRLMGIVRNLSLLPQERQGWRLHLSTQDAAWVEGLEPGELPCPWVLDERLSRGDCFLECPEGVFDARISTQLDRLEEMLREELRRGAMAEVGSDSGTN